MKIDNQHLQYLLKKFKQNEITSMEYSEMLTMLSNCNLENNMDDILEDDWNASTRILVKIIDNKKQKVKRRKFYYLGGIAASILLLISAVLYGPQLEDKSNNVIYKTSYNESKKITLTDGSVILLNANSTLSWNENWETTGFRTAELSGEAYFEIQHLDKIPFEVQSEELKIKVTGTEFNIRNRRGEVDVFLHSGSVNLKLDENKNTYLMEPGDLAKYDQKIKELKINRTSGSMVANASWVNGILSFKNESLEKILNNFEDLYGKHFIINDSLLLEKRMDLSLPYSDWNLVKEALEISLSVEFSEKKDSIIVQ